MQIELTQSQVNRIRNVYRMDVGEYINKMIPFKRLHPKQIVKICEQYFNMNLANRNTMHRVATNRRICATLICEFCDVRYAEIQDVLEYRSHANVSHARTHTYAKLGIDEQITNDYTKLKIILNEAN